MVQKHVRWLDLMMQFRPIDSLETFIAEHMRSHFSETICFRHLRGGNLFWLCMRVVGKLNTTAIEGPPLGQSFILDLRSVSITKTA